MGESGEAPRVERPGTPSPPNTGDTECVPGDTGSLHSQGTAHTRISFENLVQVSIFHSLGSKSTKPKNFGRPEKVR
jgi:hypothetical protein